MKLGSHLFECLHQLGVEHVFGLPGDFALTLFEVLEESPLQPVIMTHEPSVGFAADAYARLRGLGVALVTYGVGALNMVNAVGQAYAEKSPVIVLSGGPGVGERQAHPLLHHRVRSFETHQKVYQEVTVYSAILDDPRTADRELHRALDLVRTYKRPVYLEIPRDLVHAEIDPHHTLPRRLKSDPEALAEALEETQALLQQARKPAILAGVEVHRFDLQDELVSLAARSGLPVASTMLGKSAYPEDLPQYMGLFVGGLTNRAVEQYVESSDCLLMLGVFLSDMNLGFFTADLLPDRTIDATSERLTIKHHQYPNVHLVDFLRELAQLDLPHRNWDYPRPDPLPEPDPTGPITVANLIHEINDWVDDDTTIVADVGDCLFAGAAIRTKRRSAFVSPAYYLSMGFGVPGAIAAKIADSGRRTLCLVGDGAFQMTGWELLTARKLGLPVIVVVMNNAEYATLKFSLPQDSEFLHIPPLDYAEVAQVLGGQGYRATTAAEFRAALADASTQPEFSIIDVPLDPRDASPVLQNLAEEIRKRLQG